MKEQEIQPKVFDRGFEVWIQLFKSHLLIFVTWGIVNSYGIFQAYYKSTLLKDMSMLSISWIGTTQGFIIIIVSIFIGPIYDRGYTRLLIVSGSILTVLGLLLISTAKHYYQFFLYQSIIIGIGSGFIFIPSLGTVTQYFDKKVSLALGVATSGGSIGGLLFPIFFHYLIDKIGFAWTIRTYAFITAILLLICIIITEMYKITNRSPTLFDFSSFKEIVFLIFNVAVFFVFTGIYIPFFYLTIYGQSITSSSIPVYLISFLNLSSIFGRILVSYVADYKKPLNIFILSCLCLAVSAYIWIFVRNIAGVIVFSLFFGFFAGAAMSLPLAVITKLSTNLVYIGTQMAISSCFSGVGFLIGTPLAGFILTKSNGSFLWTQIFSATTILVGTLLLFVLLFYKRRFKINDKASSISNQ